MRVFVAEHYGFTLGVYSSLELAQAACQEAYAKEIGPGVLGWVGNGETGQHLIEPDHWISDEVDATVEAPSSAVLMMRVDAPARE